MRTEHGLRISCPQLGPDWVQCVKGPDRIARVLDEAWRDWYQLLAARQRVAEQGWSSKGRRQHNPADWTRLHAGEAKYSHPDTKRPVDCEEGSWLSPTGRVYRPDSPQVSAETRALWAARTDTPTLRVAQ